MSIVTVVLKNGTAVTGYFNGKNYNGAIYLTREGFRKGFRYALRDIHQINYADPRHDAAGRVKGGRQ